MKNKRLWIIVGITLAVILIGVIAIASISGNQEPETDISESSTDISESEITQSTDIAIPGVSEDTESSDETDESIDTGTVSKDDIDPEDIVSPAESETEPEESEPVETVKTDESTADSTPVAQPETQKTPETDSSETESPTIVIGGGDTTEKYSCGVANHHCEGPETHAYISNLELEGCPYCGSHSCVSFYGTDAWGNAQYTPSLCPQYGVTKDPLNYCQICGKPTGDGTNGTCVHYIQERDCLNCGKHVGSRECHSCE